MKKARFKGLARCQRGQLTSVKISLNWVAEMHFAINWQILNADKGPAILKEFEAVLKPYEKFQPLPNSYVVKVKTIEEYVAVTKSLIEKATGASNAIHFLVTPPMVGSKYAGRLPVTVWPEINKLSE